MDELDEKMSLWLKKASTAYVKYVEAYLATLSKEAAWEAFLEEYHKEKPERDPHFTYKPIVHNKCWPYICYRLDKLKNFPTKSWIIEKWMKIAEEPANRGEEMAALKELAKLIEAVDDQLKIQLQVPEKIEIHFTDETEPEEKI